jgi:hypothetical protein
MVNQGNTAKFEPAQARASGSSLTRSQILANDVVASLRARNPLLWVISSEEARAEQYLIEAAAAAGRTWGRHEH